MTEKKQLHMFGAMMRRHISLLPAIALLVGMFAPSAIAGAAALEPHRAVYDIRLEKADMRSGMSSVEGRFVYEIRGSVCDGYAVSQRMVTSSKLNEGGGSLIDVRSTSFENAAAKELNFIHEMLLNQKPQNLARGMAVHGDGETRLELVRPDKDSLSLPSDVRFPVEFLRGILNAAQSGEKFFESKVYDGSDGGRKVYKTSTIILQNRSGQGPEQGLPDGLSSHFKGLKYWPVTIAYFDDLEGEESMEPFYQLSVHLYENGMSGKMRLIYDQFSLEANLIQLESLAAESLCGQ